MSCFHMTLSALVVVAAAAAAVVAAAADAAATAAIATVIPVDDVGKLCVTAFNAAQNCGHGYYCGHRRRRRG